MGETICTWPGVLEPALLPAGTVAAGHQLADAARDGNWPAVFDLLDAEPTLSVNQWRPGSPKWFGVLHQAAWHGASVKVVAGLTRRGALRSLRDAQGRTAADVAAAQGHGGHLIAVLSPPPSPLAADRVQALDANLEWVIDERIHTEQILAGHHNGNPRKVLRYPPVTVLHEAPGRSVRFPIPGMDGGFRVTLRRGYLETVSRIRVPGTSGQAHVITHRGTTLVDEGFA